MSLGRFPIKLYGSEELKQRFLPKCASGEWSPAFALSEPDAGSDPGGMITRAVKDGDDWVIDGVKNWISNAGIADFYIVLAVTDRELRPRAGSRRSWSRADRKGFSIGNLEHKLGIRGSPTGQPVLDGVRVPDANSDRRGRQGLQGRIERRSIAPASESPRRRSGSPRARPTTPPPTPRSASSSASRSTPSRRSRSSSPTWRRTARQDASCSTRRPPRSTAAIRTSASSRRWRSCSAPIWRWTVTIEAIQILGGYGYVKDYPVERMMRDAKITQIYEGTNEIQRVVIARTLA